jgi:hypothetical protein
MARKKQEFNPEEFNVIKPSIPNNLPALPEIPQTWGPVSEKSKKAMQLAYRMYATKHGLLASIPLVCRAEKCPYAETCIAQLYGTAPVGERCPVEMVNIMHKFVQYCEELNIDKTKMVNLGLIKELIDCEVMIERCNALLAKSGELIPDVIALVDDQGTPYYKPEIHKAIEIKDKNQKRKNEILQLLNSTPKDKAKTEGVNITDPSSYAAEILKRFQEAQQERGEVLEGEIIEEDSSD